MNKSKFFTLTILLLLFAVACGGGASELVEVTRVVTETETVVEEVSVDRLVSGGDFDDAADFEFEEAMAEEMAADGELSFAANAPAESVAQQAPTAQQQERLIIRNAQMDLLVSDTDATIKTITEMVEANGGWVVNSSVYQYSADAKSGNITVRVPSDGFTSALDAVRGLAVEVTSESISGQDVTEEFVDLGSRLENLEATADRVRAFLDDANRVEDALDVNRELSRLEGEIEVIKGRMKYLSESAAFSTIRINLTPDIVSQPIEVIGWRPAGIAREAIDALLGTLQGLATIVIWVAIYILPMAILLGVPAWFGFRFWRNRRRTSRPTPPAPTPAE